MGTPAFTNAIFTVNSPFRLINSFVPSNGSTIHITSQLRRVSYSKCFPSSLSTGKGVSFRMVAIVTCAFRSAIVKGE